MGSHIQLNGLNNDYILIMINGKRMNGDIGGQNDLNQLKMCIRDSRSTVAHRCTG